MTFFNARKVLREQRDFGGIHNAFENPTVPLSSVGLDYAFGQSGGTDSGQNMSHDIANTIPVYWRCCKLMANVIASCPLRAYIRESKEEFFPDLLEYNNTDMRYTQHDLWELVVLHLATWGNAYVLKVRRSMLEAGHDKKVKPNHPSAAEIVDLRPFNPERVKVKMQNGQKIFLVTRVDKNGKIDNTQKPQVFTDYEVMHISGPSIDGLMGLDPVSLFRRTLGTSIAADKLAGRFFKDGTTLTGVINVKAPLASQEQADDIRRRWLQKNGGLDGAAQVAVLDAETEFQPLTINPDVLQFLESRRWQTTEIARIFGIPPHLVGDVEKSTSWGTGIEQQNVAFISYTVSEYTCRIEQRVSRELIKTKGKFAAFDLDRLMRGDMSERYTAYGNAITNGWLNRNEVRKKEDMPPGAGLNDFLMPLNMVTVQMAKQQGAAQLEQMKNPQPPPGAQTAQPDDDDDDSDNDQENDS